MLEETWGSDLNVSFPFLGVLFKPFYGKEQENLKELKKHLIP